MISEIKVGVNFLKSDIFYLKKPKVLEENRRYECVLFKNDPKKSDIICGWPLIQNLQMKSNIVVLLQQILFHLLCLTRVVFHHKLWSFPWVFLFQQCRPVYLYPWIENILAIVNCIFLNWVDIFQKFRTFVCEVLTLSYYTVISW